MYLRGQLAYGFSPTRDGPRSTRLKAKWPVLDLRVAYSGQYPATAFLTGSAKAGLSSFARDVDARFLRSSLPDLIRQSMLNGGFSMDHRVKPGGDEADMFVSATIP